MGQYGNVVFIVWRESVEALLVIGILNAWLSSQAGRADLRRGRLYLFGGVAAGLLVAVFLGALLMYFSNVLSSQSQQIYETAMVLVAAALIVQMVFWMRKHGRTLKRELETALQGEADRSHWWGVFVLAAIAVAREGSETVVFLAGTISASAHETLAYNIVAALGGFALALASYALLQIGGKIFSWRVFFRFTEIMLLFLAASLLVAGVDNLIALGWLPSLSGQLWDTSAIVPDTGLVGGLLASLAGYRAEPVLMETLVYAAYWGCMAWLLLKPRPKRA